MLVAVGHYADKNRLQFVLEATTAGTAQPNQHKSKPKHRYEAARAGYAEYKPRIIPESWADIRHRV